MASETMETLCDLRNPRWQRGYGSAAGSVAGALDALVSAMGFGERDRAMRQLRDAIWMGVPVSWRPQADEIADKIAEQAIAATGGGMMAGGSTAERSRVLRAAMACGTRR